MYEIASHSFINHTLSLSSNNSNDHRSTETKVFSSDTNTNVYSSGQNRENHLLKEP